MTEYSGARNGEHADRDAGGSSHQACSTTFDMAIGKLYAENYELTEETKQDVTEAGERRSGGVPAKA